MPEVVDDHDPRRTIGSSVFVCLAASIISFASASDECGVKDSCDHGYYVWAITCGVISTLVCLFRLIFIYQTARVDPKLEMTIAMSLVILWAFGTAFNTSASGPFSATKNGYFATWIAFMAAASYASAALPSSFDTTRSRVAMDNIGLLLVLISSLVEMAVAADVCNVTDSCTGRQAFAVAAGAVSSILCLFQLLLLKFAPSAAESLTRVLSIFLVAWWATGAAFNTSAKGPFNSSCGGARGAANGYFSTWSAFFSALFMCYNSLHPTAEGYETI
eukprot:m.80608 g.80608  ORF g.80608 m.80608 type:complete len:275 (+) comp14215_c2_seq2:505-1329(+)